jgi:N-methylhydantoinase A
MTCRLENARDEQGMARLRLGIDIGGTFTDIILLEDDGTLHRKKILSTPDDYSRAIEEGILSLLRQSGFSAENISQFAHGTTVATNTIIERKGVKVALVTTKGFRDVLELGRFRSPRLYDIRFRKPEPLVRRSLRFEVAERISGGGALETPVDLGALDEIAATMRAERIEAVAICFINSYINPENELAAQRYLQERMPDIPVCASVQLLPQVQEFERSSTTVVNAYIRPVIERYVASLAQRMRRIGIRVPLLIMQSSGGILSADHAGANPVYIIESGPAAGVVGAQRLGQHLKLGNLMVLDIGGTTAKASIVQDGEFTVMPESEVGDANAGHRLIQGAGYAVQVPTIDIAEVGAGGGSIAHVDAAGGIHVGPRSAGAVPGPVSYDQGGQEPTLTDANLVLGYLNPDTLVGGDLSLAPNKAKAAIEALGQRIEQPAIETAYGIHQIANAMMMRALSAVSSGRGHDPAQFTLVAIGGNGGVHAAGLAESLRIDRILVPPVAGLFSALGLLFADIEHQVVRGFYRRGDDVTDADLNLVLGPMESEARRLLASDGFAEDNQEITAFAEMRYVGQTWTLRVPFPGLPASNGTLTALQDRFGQAHEQNYGYRSDHEKVQFVALKVVGRGAGSEPSVPERLRPAREDAAHSARRLAYFGPDIAWLETPVVARSALSTSAMAGPAIIEEYDSTTVVRPGWHARLDSWNNVLIERSRSA